MKYLSSKGSSGFTLANCDRRITAIGCQNGWLGVYFVDSFKNGLFNLNYRAKNRVFDIWIPFISGVREPHQN